MKSWMMIISVQLIVLSTMLGWVHSHGGGGGRDEFPDQRRGYDDEWDPDEMGYDREDMDFDPEWPGRRSRGGGDFWSRVIFRFCRRFSEEAPPNLKEEGAEDAIPMLIEECEMLRQMRYRPRASFELLQLVFSNPVLAEELRIMVDDWENMIDY